MLITIFAIHSPNLEPSIMTSTRKLKIFNDPIYGFIAIPNVLIFNLIEHPYFQRLRRISQMGLSSLVYPGAHHSRFHHAIGSMHLMTKAIETLRFKGVVISEDEEKALLAAILLHDIGHGPFSHTLEHSIIENCSHEALSLFIMESLNKTFDGALSLAIQMFKGEYHRAFCHELLNGQFDMDRADYLKRDSFFTGVSEGNINSDRLILMLNVVDDHLVIEENGIFPLEKFLTARRLMYWQVYLHKTSLAAEQLLTLALKRAKELSLVHFDLKVSGPLAYFLDRQIDQNNFDQEAIDAFVQLDDYDIMYAIKMWQYTDDLILANLCQMIVQRRLPKVEIKKSPISTVLLRERLTAFQESSHLSEKEAVYFVFKGEISNQAYNTNDKLRILMKNGKVTSFQKASDQFSTVIMNEPTVRYFMCYPKGLV